MIEELDIAIGDVVRNIVHNVVGIAARNIIFDEYLYVIKNIIGKLERKFGM